MPLEQEGRRMARRERDAEAELNLPPGFRFHPTDEELVVHYLALKVASKFLPVHLIAEVDLYKFDPWELPEKALFGQREWYFFTPRDRKYPNGSRPNRTAGRGYWKATGADKPVSTRGCSHPLGIKKALVFYTGKAPKGVKTDWIMHEYRLTDTNRAPNKKGNLRLDEWVLCRLYNKKNSWEKIQQQKMQQQEEAYSFGETMDSLEAFHDTGSKSLGTPESDIENEAFPEFEDLSKPGAHLSQNSSLVQPVKLSHSSSFQAAEQRPKEENEWFLDLNLDDLQGSFLAFGSDPAVDHMVNQEYYFPTLGSYQSNLPPF